MAKAPAAFIDRDGVLVEDRDYAYRWDDAKLMPGAAHAVAELKRLGYKLIVVTNQSGVARGYFNLHDVWAFNRAIQAQLQREAGVQIDAFYICPHHPKGIVTAYARDCSCRKPGVQLLLDAARDFDIDLSRSVMFGDKPSDIECGERLGIASFQIGLAHKPHPNAKLRATSLREAIEAIGNKTWGT